MIIVAILAVRFLVKLRFPANTSIFVSNGYGIMGIIFTISRHLTELWGGEYPFQGTFHNFQNYGPDFHSICGIMALKSTRIYGIMGTIFSGKMARPVR